MEKRYTANGQRPIVFMIHSNAFDNVYLPRKREEEEMEATRPRLKVVKHGE